MREITWREAICQALDEEMEKDPSVFIMGEMAGIQGGIYGQFKGLFQKYGGERVKDTPISESAILGAAIGSALNGMRPVADLIFTDFFGVCFDDIMNQLPKTRYVFGGQMKMPVTVLGVMGAGEQGGAEHSQCIEGMLINIPGLKVVVPSTPYDAKGLLKSSVRDDNAVVFLSHRMLMLGNVKSQVPEGEYSIPLGKADIKREGSDITVVATALMVHRALNAAKKLQEKGISLEIIDPRTLVPLDKETILSSVAKTGRLVVFTEECKTGSAAGEIAAIVAEEAFDCLHAPIRRVNAPNTPVPFSPPLEKFYMPDEDALIKAVNDIAS